jgi:ArsR family transcriptional regulator
MVEEEYYMNMNSYSCCTGSNQKNITSLSELLKLVSEESRLKLLCILQTGEHCVCEMTEHVNLSQSLISHHLKDLKDAGLVTDTKRGLRVYYALTEKGTYTIQSLFHILNKGVEKK